jgi:hypothetical protein
MKFVSLRTERPHRPGESDKTSHGTQERFTKPIPAPHQIHTYTELRKRIHDDLRVQHPDWVEPNGECPTCDSYEARLAKLLDTYTGKGTKSIVLIVAPSNTD